MVVDDVNSWKEKFYYILEDEVKYEIGAFVNEDGLTR